MDNTLTQTWNYMLNMAGIAHDAVIIEVAPGYKSKIGKALATMDFSGEIFLVEPNPDAARVVHASYVELLPLARVNIVTKRLSDVIAGVDVPKYADALIANHPLDDMVLSKNISMEKAKTFFSLNSGQKRISKTRELWEGIPSTRLGKSVRLVTEEWVCALSELQPKTLVIAQYKSNTLQENHIYTPDIMGKRVLDGIATQVNATLNEPCMSYFERHEYAGRWLMKHFVRRDLLSDTQKMPDAMRRLNRRIFVKETARKMSQDEYNVIYTNNSLLKSLGYIKDETQEEINSLIGNAFAYVLVQNKEVGKANDQKMVYADFQADPTGIALSGNKGSGRACYMGSDFNIKGIGRTQFAMHPEDLIHGSGKLDLVTALREAIVTDYLCKETDASSAPIIAVIALREKIPVPWKKKLVSAALLVRLDKGALDRPSHLAYAKLQRPLNLDRIVRRYARMDAEMFAKRIFHGAWSTGNISLDGHFLDIESVSMVSGRGPRCNITKKYLSNYFGYESLGAKQVIKQLSEMLGGNFEECIRTYDEERGSELSKQFLQLLGILSDNIDFIIKNISNVQGLALQFEFLARKISPRSIDFTTFGNSEKGNHLLDFSELFRNLPEIIKNFTGETRLMEARKHFLRTSELEYCMKLSKRHPTNTVEEYIVNYNVVDEGTLQEFLHETNMFLENLFQCIDMLSKENLLLRNKRWEGAVAHNNKEIPSFYELTEEIECWLQTRSGGVKEEFPKFLLK
ncbi:MAG: hypothetical protein HZA36_03435 [Parcubacteria group bacterium]|nr:hypothetical protein [Parcubacteria group bacterium]